MEGQKEVIHELSSVAPLDRLELWSVTPTQISIEKDVTTEHRPMSVVSSSQQLDFEVITAKDEYIDFSETYLKLTGRVVLLKNSDVTKEDWDAVIPAQYFMHSIFNQVDIQIGNKEITLQPQTYQYKAYLEALLGFSDNAKNTHLRTAGWGTDAQRNARIRPADPKSNEGRTFELQGKLHLDLTFQEKLLLGGCSVKITLNPEDSKFYFQAPAGVIPTLVLQEAQLFVSRAKVYPHLASAHDQAINAATAKYPITRSEVRRQGIPQGQLDAVLDNVIRGQMPRRMFVVLVSTSAFNGSLSTNPYEFKHFNVNFMAAYVDGVQFPYKPYTPNFENGLYSNEYNSLYRVLRQNNTDPYISLTEDDFVNGKAIFAFNFSPTRCSGPGINGHVDYIERGYMRLHIRFTEQLKAPVNVLIYAEFDNLVQIDEMRNVYTNFN